MRPICLNLYSLLGKLGVWVLLLIKSIEEYLIRTERFPDDFRKLMLRNQMYMTLTKYYVDLNHVLKITINFVIPIEL